MLEKCSSHLWTISSFCFISAAPLEDLIDATILLTWLYTCFMKLPCFSLTSSIISHLNSSEYLLCYGPNSVEKILRTNCPWVIDFCAVSLFFSSSASSKLSSYQSLFIFLLILSLPGAVRRRVEERERLIILTLIISPSACSVANAKCTVAGTPTCSQHILEAL